jgi:hypothetical protein
MAVVVLRVPDGLVEPAGRAERTRARTLEPTREGVADVR